METSITDHLHSPTLPVPFFLLPHPSPGSGHKYELRVLSLDWGVRKLEVLGTPRRPHPEDPPVGPNGNPPNLTGRQLPFYKGPTRTTRRTSCLLHAEVVGRPN